MNQLGFYINYQMTIGVSFIHMRAWLLRLACDPEFKHIEYQTLGAGWPIKNRWYCLAQKTERDQMHQRSISQANNQPKYIF